jgi:hypothetical protein
MSKTELIKQLNALRLANRDKWVFYTAQIDGVTINYKAYNTWVQIIEFDGIKTGSGMGMSPTEFKAYINKTITERA